MTNEAVERVREHEEWRVEYMTLAMKYSEKKEEGRIEGRIEEHDKILENLTKNLMKRNPKLTLEEAKKEAEDLIKVM